MIDSDNDADNNWNNFSGLPYKYLVKSKNHVLNQNTDRIQSINGLIQSQLTSKIANKNTKKGINPIITMIALGRVSSRLRTMSAKIIVQMPQPSNRRFAPSGVELHLKIALIINTKPIINISGTGE